MSIRTARESVKPDLPAPPKIALDLADALEAGGWETHAIHTTGAGNHPSRGYVHAAFFELWATKDDLRVEVRWIAETPSAMSAGWSPTAILGRWAAQTSPTLHLRGSFDPEKFRILIRLGLAKGYGEPGPVFRLSTLNVVRELAATPTPADLVERWITVGATT